MIEIQSSRKRGSLQTFAESAARILKIDAPQHKILVILKPDVRKEHGADGVTMQIGPVHLIFIQSTMTLTQIGQTLCHELVHVKDLITGRMKILGGGKRSWCGKIYDSEKTPYLDQPWERHAMSLEVSLFHRALQG